MIPFHPGPLDQLRKLEYEHVAEEARQGRFQAIRGRCCILILMPIILFVIILVMSFLADVL